MRIKQLKDVEGAQLPMVSGGLSFEQAQRPGGSNPRSNLPGTHWASLRMFSPATLWATMNTPPCLAWALQTPKLTQGHTFSPGAGPAAGAVHEAAGGCGVTPRQGHTLGTAQELLVPWLVPGFCHHAMLVELGTNNGGWL